MNTPGVQSVQTARTVRSDRFLLLLVFLAGVGTLGIEMVMPRLLAPFFGTSQPIWAVVIGMTLIYLATGYQVGGWLADRWPDQRVLYRLVAWAGLLCGMIPLLSRPILHLAQQSLSGLAAGGFLAALVGVVLLFAAPVILMATVGPFAVRLQLHRAASGIEAAGRTAGSISALSTVGSIVGTFLPVLVLIPWIGTQRTIYLFAAFLLALGLSGLRDWRYAWMVVLVVGLAAWTLFFSGSAIKAADCYGCLALDEAESSYNYIQVVTQNVYGDKGEVAEQVRTLRLNEGHANHSMYRLKYRETGDPLDLLTAGPWDYFAVAPYVYPDRSAESVTSLAMLGSAAGTVPKQFLAFYGPDTHIDAVEIDPRIVEMGLAYFDMEAGDPRFPVYTVFTQDARYWLSTTRRAYDVIAMDAYHQPYIPFHLTTVEFFREAKAHLNERGVVVVNAGRPPGGDDRLVNAVASTMRAVFPQVFLIDSRAPRSTSVLVVGVSQPVGDGVAHFRANAEQMEVPALRLVMQWALFEGHEPLREFTPDQARFTPFTDDQAPVELLIDLLIVGEARQMLP
ncbi:MAG: fused MFS/spermidine synthase [Chloroflexaceae bacterium]|nr:fused MFS/spermidine synthase [Chloroflexaceae bacterium]